MMCCSSLKNVLLILKYMYNKKMPIPIFKCRLIETFFIPIQNVSAWKRYSLLDEHWIASNFLNDLGYERGLFEAKSSPCLLWWTVISEQRLLCTFHQGFVILWWMFIPFCKSDPIKSGDSPANDSLLNPCNLWAFLKTVTKCWHCEGNYLSAAAVFVW